VNCEQSRFSSFVSSQLEPERDGPGPERPGPGPMGDQSSAARGLLEMPRCPAAAASRAIARCPLARRHLGNDGGRDAKEAGMARSPVGLPWILRETTPSMQHHSTHIFQLHQTSSTAPADSSPRRPSQLTNQWLASSAAAVSQSQLLTQLLPSQPCSASPRRCPGGCDGAGWADGGSIEGNRPFMEE
jgi:hypothetical protein